MQLQITSSGKSRSFRVIEKVCQDGKTSSRVINLRFPKK